MGVPGEGRAGRAKGRALPLGQTSRGRASRARDEALACLRLALQRERPWPQALLTAIGRWPLPEEEVQGAHYRYLLLGEAFDWLVLAERLLLEVDGLLPRQEQERLLFCGQFPEPVPEEEFRSLLGPEKYRAHLNFFYGVVVEESLQLAVEEAVWKRHASRGFIDGGDPAEIAYQRLYQGTPQELLGAFLGQLGRPPSDSLTLTQWKEFTYWLFQRRTHLWDPARVGSDTQKGLERLFRLRLGR